MGGSPNIKRIKLGAKIFTVCYKSKLPADDIIEVLEAMLTGMKKNRENNNEDDEV